MKRISALLAISFLAVALSGCGKTYSVTPGFKLEANEAGYCKLTNVEKGKELYSGRCTVKQRLDVDKNKYIITMGANEPVIFVKRGSDAWEYLDKDGRTETVRYRDRGQMGIFRWGELRLEIDNFN